MNIWYRDKTVDDNLTCDICGYQHAKPDTYGIVVECPDGINRCKVCRGEGKYNGHEPDMSEIAAVEV